MHGKFFWYDLMTTDTSAAARFYCDVVGWESRDSGTGRDYTLFTTDGRPMAGLMPIPAEARGDAARPVWMGYIAVDDVDAAVTRIQEMGGRIYKPAEDVPGVIRFAVVADPQGAVFLVAKGLMEGPPPLPNTTPGAVGWRELYAKDWDAAFGFYAAMFGWTKDQAIDMGPMGTYQLFATGAEAVGGMMTKPPFIPAPFWGYYINVPALGASIERVAAGGGKVTHGPVEVPGGSRIVQCTDPQGAYFALVAPQQ